MIDFTEIMFEWGNNYYFQFSDGQKMFFDIDQVNIGELILNASTYATLIDDSNSILYLFDLASRIVGVENVNLLSK